MNAVTLLREMETIGAREFRHKLDKMLRHPVRPCRVMLHNKPAIAVLSDESFLQILELLQELKEDGLLERVMRKLETEHKKRHVWFWSRSWQKKERQADREIVAGKVRRANSAEDLIRQLNA